MMTFAESQKALTVWEERHRRLRILRLVSWALFVVNVAMIGFNGWSSHRIDGMRRELNAKAVEINTAADELTAKSADLRNWNAVVIEQSRQLKEDSDWVGQQTKVLNALDRKVMARICKLQALESARQQGAR